MTTARDPQKKKRAPSKGRVLLWAGVFLLNFVLLTAAVSLAVFPQAGPLTAERLARLPYFEGCELLDVHTRAGGSARLFGQSDADWVLYRNSAGETRLVGVSWSLYTCLLYTSPLRWPGPSGALRSRTGAKRRAPPPSAPRWRPRALRWSAAPAAWRRLSSPHGAAKGRSSPFLSLIHI